jgi:hypothetical protein
LAEVFVNITNFLPLVQLNLLTDIEPTRSMGLESLAAAAVSCWPSAALKRMVATKSDSMLSAARRSGVATVRLPYLD